MKVLENTKDINEIKPTISKQKSGSLLKMLKSYREPNNPIITTRNMENQAHQTSQLLSSTISLINQQRPKTSHRVITTTTFKAMEDTEQE